MTQEDIKDTLEYFPLTGNFIHLKTHRNVKEGSIAGANVAPSKKSKHNKTYRRICVKGKYIAAHRAAFLYMWGYIPKGEVDHINHNSLDNRWENLRIVTHKENGKNQKKYTSNTSGVTGVRLRSNGKWRARIYHDGSHIDLGTFEKKEDALSARRGAEILYGFHRNHGTCLK